MRICIVSRELDPFYGAGIGVYVSASARAWAAAGHEVHVVTEGHVGLSEGDLSEPSAQAGGPVRKDDDRIGEEFVSCGNRTGNRTGDRTGDGPARGGSGLDEVAGFEGIAIHVVDPIEREDLAYFHLRHALGVSRKLCTLHEAHGFDYIEFADYFAEGAFALHGRRRGVGGARLAGAVLGVRLHTPSIECWAINEERALPDESVAMGPLEYRALAAADVLISPSRALLDRVNATLGVRGLRRPRGHVVAYPFRVDVPEFGLVGAGDLCADGSTTVLCFGRLERRKGVHVLAAAAVEMLERGSPARFVFVGGDTNTGPSQTSMREHVLSLIPERWHGRITIESAVPRQEVLERIRSCTLCCFPAIWDNFPNALLEAMALGKAIVATSGSGMGEMIEDERSGLLVAPGEVSELAGAIGRALLDGPLRERLGAEARRRVERLCNPSGVVGEMEEVIGNAKPSMRRDFRRWTELAPALESRSVLARARLALKRRMGRSAP